MAETASLQMDLLQRELRKHHDGWKTLLKSSEPSEPKLTLLQQAPSFMKMFGSHLGPSFVVVSAANTEVIQPQTENIKKEVSSKEIVVPIGLEIEGTPLEAPFTEEEMDMLNSKLTVLNLNFFPIDKFSPLPTTFARNVLMWQAFALAEVGKAKKLKSCDLSPLVVICKEDNLNGRLQPSCLMAVASELSPNDTTIEANFLGQLDFIEMTEARNEFYKVFTKKLPAPLPESNIISSVLRAEYLQQTLHLGDTAGKENSKADCFHIKMLWKNPKSRNSDIPISQSSASLTSIEISLQDNWHLWECGKIWEEILLLKELSSLLNQDMPDNDFTLSAVFGEAPNKSINQLLNMAENEIIGEKYGTISLEGLFKTVSNGIRPCTDLTDAIWNTLKFNCRVMDMAKEIENVLKKCVANDFEVKLSNKSEVGLLARDLFQTKDATLICAFDFKQTVLSILEIGFLKVQRDFSFVAQHSKLMVSSQISKALDCSSWQEKIGKLSQVHQAFEVVLRAKKWLHLEHESLSNLFVESLKVPLLQTISVQVPSVHLGHIIKCYQPVIRSWKYEVSRGAARVRHTFLASQYPIFSWTENSICSKETVDNTPLKTLFYSASLTETVRKFP